MNGVNQSRRAGRAHRTMATGTLVIVSALATMLAATTASVAPAQDAATANVRDSLAIAVSRAGAWVEFTFPRLTVADSGCPDFIHP